MTRVDRPGRRSTGLGWRRGAGIRQTDGLHDAGLPLERPLEPDQSQIEPGALHVTGSQQDFTACRLLPFRRLRRRRRRRRGNQRTGNRHDLVSL